MVEVVEVMSAVLALIAGAGALAIVVARFAAPSDSSVARLAAAVVARRTEWTLAVAGFATAGSLYFSEVANYNPCRLCWFQRIAMYPIALIALVALIRRDRGDRWYTVPLASIGILVSAYHFLIERGVLADSDSCSVFGPPCSAVWFEEFGFVTLAFMALAGFLAVIVLNTISFPTPFGSSDPAGSDPTHREVP